MGGGVILLHDFIEKGGIPGKLWPNETENKFALFAEASNFKDVFEPR